VNRLKDKPYPMDGVKLHVQPGGTVVATYDLGGGRQMRVCGARPYRGCKVCEEMHKVLIFEGRIPAA
jgi:hypothetical protein